MSMFLKKGGRLAGLAGPPYKPVLLKFIMLAFPTGPTNANPNGFNFELANKIHDSKHLLEGLKRAETASKVAVQNAAR